MKRETKQDTDKIQRIIRSYYKKLYSTKLENVKDNVKCKILHHHHPWYQSVKEMDNFLDRYHISKLNQDWINNLNKHITFNDLNVNINTQKLIEKKVGSSLNAWAQKITS